ncbi:cyclin-domain-containing protein [Flagelloscypha sp. PMI_526]|nr:cyclin-domain-containing protein [Flagelloscypha sp. PMI_526]
MEGGKIVVPSEFEQCSPDIVVELIADMLDRVTAHNDRIPLQPEGLTYFHSRSPPNLSIIEYLRRIHRFANVEPACLLVSLYYIDKFCARMPTFTLSSLSAHRFLITAITVACKTFCDVIGKAALYAKVGGITLSELNMLERELLNRLEWSLMCTREVLQDYYVNLIRSHTSNRYVIVGAPNSDSSESGMSDSDLDADSGQSRPPSPMAIDPGTRQREDTASQTSTERPRPTVEQNMAFAAHQQQQDKGDP